MKAEDADIVFEGSAVPGWSRVFVLGSLDRRVTLYSQQVRALNLAAAMFAKGAVSKGDPVVVVGAGAAGLTCAAGLTHLGASVTVLESGDDILPLFGGGSARWLHPGVYDWPASGWSRERAGLPLMTWEAAPVPQVREQLRAAWELEGTQVTVIPGAKDVYVDVLKDDRRPVSWNPGGRAHLTAAVVLAVGFGLEPKRSIGESRYWEADDLDGVSLDGARRCWLVSGSGDGALTDLMRLCLRDFRHDRMLADFVTDPRMQAVKEQILDLETNPAGVPAARHQAYLSLSAPWVTAIMRERLRSDTHVALNAPVVGFLDAGASALNRFLVGQLHQIGAFDLVGGKIEAVKNTGRLFEVTFDDGTTRPYDRIVRRHGPEPALAKDFPAIWEALTPLRQARKHMPVMTDRTRTRLWEPGLFGAEDGGPHADPEPAAPRFRAVIATADDVDAWREAVEVAMTRDGGAVEVLRTGDVADRLQKVRESDALVLVVGHRLGGIPGPELGGDGQTPLLTLALDAATSAGVAVVAAAVDVGAPWSQRREQDELDDEDADIEAVRRRVLALKALRRSLPEPLGFGSQGSAQRPADLGSAVVSRLRALLTAPDRGRTWTIHVEHPLQPAPHFHGRAELLAQLSEWWDDPASPDRVTTLVAIGGAGKTAIAERWLRHVTAHPAGGGVFVWSFYESPNVEQFLRSACQYFAEEPGQDHGGRLFAIRDALRHGEAHLLVLDGLERVQSDAGAGRARGQLTDPLLRQLLQFLAAGPGRARALVTSRYELVDLQAWRGSGLRAERVDELDPEAAVAVLRSWGVDGPDGEVLALAEKVGRHALSVAVLGSYIASFGGGDASFGARLDLHEAGALDPAANRLAKLLTAYAQEMDDGERQVMARLSLFSEGIAIQVLADLVTNEGVAGALVRMKETGLVRLLTRLVQRGLAFRYRRTDEIVYTAHPFVRDAFSALLDVPAAEIHSAMAEHLRAGLEDRPGVRPRDPKTLDRYESLIEHLIGAGNVQGAFDLYAKSLGGYRHLRAIGNHTRAARIIDRFPDLLAPAAAPHPIAVRDRTFLLTDRALANMALGDLDRAAEALEADETLTRTLNRPEDLLTTFGNQTELAWLKGTLPVALRLAQEAVDFAKAFALEGQAVDSSWHLSCSLGWTGTIRTLTGSVADGVEAYERATTVLGAPMTSGLGILQALMVARLGDRTAAAEQLRDCLSTAQADGDGNETTRSHIGLGMLALPDDPAGAREHLAPARDWATRTGDLEAMIDVHRLAAAILAATGDIDGALAELRDGIQQADGHGFGLHSIDLRVDRAQLQLGRGDPKAAQRDARFAHDRSADPSCAYAWGEADAAHILGEALLAQGDRRTATRYFTDALGIRTQIQHPEVDITRRRLEELEAL